MWYLWGDELPRPPRKAIYMDSLTRKLRAKAVEEARKKYGSTDIEIDNETTKKGFSEADKGVWVRAWVWVPDEALGVEP